MPRSLAASPKTWASSSLGQQTAGLDPAAGLAIVQKRFWNGMSVPHMQVPGADMAKHRLERRPDLAIRIVEQVAEPDREADLEVEPRVLERLPDPVGQVEPVAIEERPVRKAVGQVHLRVGVAVHPALKDPELGQETLALVGVARRRAECERDRHPESGRGRRRPEGTVVPGSGARAIGVLGDELDHVQAGTRIASSRSR
jgi:hypothetical protein